MDHIVKDLQEFVNQKLEPRVLLPPEDHKLLRVVKSSMYNFCRRETILASNIDIFDEV